MHSRTGGEVRKDVGQFSKGEFGFQPLFRPLLCERHPGQQFGSFVRGEVFFSLPKVQNPPVEGRRQGVSGHPP